MHVGIFRQSPAHRTLRVRWPVALLPLLALGQTPSPALLQRAMNPNPALQSYVASVSLTAKLNALVPVRKTFKGTVYYLKPKQKIVFEDVSGPLSKFKELASTLPTFEEAAAEYAIEPLADDGTIATYTLTPSTPGRRVKTLTLAVDDRTALVVRATWAYTDGGSLSFAQTYATLDAFHVPARELISARFPAYSVDGTLQFSGYRLNASIPPAILAPGG